MRSKGRQSHAVKKKNDRQPVIQIDFSFMATENDLPKLTVLNATDVQTGCSMAVVLPSKGGVEKYGVAELRKFVFEIGRTFGIVQYDKEAPLKTMTCDLCKTIGGFSIARSADWTLSESRECWECPTDTVWTVENTAFSGGGIDWREVEFGVANVHMGCKACAMADQPLHDWH